MDVCMRVGIMDEEQSMCLLSTCSPACHSGSVSIVTEQRRDRGPLWFNDGGERGEGDEEEEEEGQNGEAREEKNVHSQKGQNKKKREIKSSHLQACRHKSL
ncbi:unnamed protein product [Pleuronectes platessa]|uniref:Uncharacterized protein n=1 Tax=Pleuronectes platessa TaxID=8262 RepID=A0A9N7VBS9_PLEPL|nr:unnamed protein product [Pleuronectes platessa]